MLLYEALHKLVTQYPLLPPLWLHLLFPYSFLAVPLKFGTYSHHGAPPPPPLPTISFASGKILLPIWPSSLFHLSLVFVQMLPSLRGLSWVSCVKYELVHIALPAAHPIIFLTLFYFCLFFFLAPFFFLLGDILPYVKPLPFALIWIAEKQMMAWA